MSGGPVDMHFRFQTCSIQCRLAWQFVDHVSDHVLQFSLQNWIHCRLYRLLCLRLCVLFDSSRCKCKASILLIHASRWSASHEQRSAKIKGTDCTFTRIDTDIHRQDTAHYHIKHRPHESQHSASPKQYHSHSLARDHHFDTLVIVISLWCVDLEHALGLRKRLRNEMKSFTSPCLRQQTGPELGGAERSGARSALIVMQSGLGLMRCVSARHRPISRDQVAKEDNSDSADHHAHEGEGAATVPSVLLHYLHVYFLADRCNLCRRNIRSSRRSWHSLMPKHHESPRCLRWRYTDYIWMHDSAWSTWLLRTAQFF